MVADTKLYELLGVKPDADDRTIKRAYMLKAKELHPDKNRDDPHATEKFQAVNEFLNHSAIYDANGVVIIRNIATSAIMAQLWDSCRAAMEHGMTFSNEKIAIIVFDHKLPRQDFKIWL